MSCNISTENEEIAKGFVQAKLIASQTRASFFLLIFFFLAYKNASWPKKNATLSHIRPLLFCIALFV